MEWKEGKLPTYLSVSHPGIRPRALRMNAWLFRCTTTCAAKSYLEIRPTIEACLVLATATPYSIWTTSFN
ncbi:hypothetical protein EMPG_17050 [Blastomyces silverae]|uniref:Uncharacterized protein n=1 Tax=Blastomyces silverae TaxID=2060906 RepID=A0A0H1B8Y6_9EURO|nr:hypothetical protein EMPG_17050 [Blastomyces silverae]